MLDGQDGWITQPPYILSSITQRFATQNAVASAETAWEFADQPAIP
jgi:hypothetical protein